MGRGAARVPPSREWPQPGPPPQAGGRRVDGLPKRGDLGSVVRHSVATGFQWRHGCHPAMRPTRDKPGYLGFISLVWSILRYCRFMDSTLTNQEMEPKTLIPGSSREMKSPTPLGPRGCRRAAAVFKGGVSGCQCQSPHPAQFTPLGAPGPLPGALPAGNDFRLGAALKVSGKPPPETGSETAL